MPPVSTLARLLRVFLSLTLVVNGIGTPMAAHAHSTVGTAAGAPADAAKTCHEAGAAGEPAAHAGRSAHADPAAHDAHAAHTAHHATATAALAAVPPSHEVAAAPTKSDPMGCCEQGHCRCGCVMHVALKPTAMPLLAKTAPAPIAAILRVSQSSAHPHPLLRPPAA